MRKIKKENPSCHPNHAMEFKQQTIQLINQITSDHFKAETELSDLTSNSSTVKHFYNMVIFF